MLHPFLRFHVNPISRLVEHKPRLASGAPFSQLSFTRILLLVCPFQTIGVLGLAGGTIVDQNIASMHNKPSGAPTIMWLSWGSWKVAPLPLGGLLVLAMLSVLTKLSISAYSA